LGVSLTVSACLIVKNEAAFFEGCLLSLRGKVDQVVLVDTGSTDATRNIALQHGCDVHDFAWCDDFSAARNYGLERASCDWILYIDADERLSLDGDTGLGELLPRSAPAARVRFRPRSDMTCYDELRLFLNDPRIRFEGSMHETIVPSVDAIAAADAMSVVNLHSVMIEHLGYDGNQDHKHVRNLPLLKQAITQDPGRVYLRYHLGYTLNEIGKSADAAQQLQAGLDLAFTDGRSDRARMEGAMCAQLLTSILLQEGKAPEALAVAERGLILSNDNISLKWTQARSLVELGSAKEALDILIGLNDVNSLDGEEFFDPKIAYAKSLFTEDIPALMGSAHFRLGQYAEAARYFEQALQAAPGSIEYKAKLALCQSRHSQILQDT
jgi:tetratricopeptide (TPR) repeat protein